MVRVRLTPDARPTRTKIVKKKRRIVYITSAGKHYHKSTCGCVYWDCMPMHYSVAKQRGYKACGLCKKIKEKHKGLVRVGDVTERITDRVWDALTQKPNYRMQYIWEALLHPDRLIVVSDLCAVLEDDILEPYAR